MRKPFNYFNNLSLWQIVEGYIPAEIAKALELKDSFRLAYRMLNDPQWEGAWHQFAADLLEEVRKTHPQEWESNWRYDAFLGYACDIALRYDKRYEAYRRAFEKAKIAPPELLVDLARCYSTPGVPPISEDEAIILVQQAIKTTLYIEAVALLRGLYKIKEDFEKMAYWDKILEAIKDNGIHLPPIGPEFLYKKTASLS